MAKHQQPAPWFTWLLVCALCLVFTQAQAGNRRHRLKYQDRTRYYFVHIPPQHQTKYALVINLHGGGGQGRAQEEFSEMDKVADRYGFYVVYPNGTGKLHDRLVTWNAGSCCGYAYTHHIDDVGRVGALRETVGVSSRLRCQLTFFVEPAVVAVAKKSASGLEEPGS